eukprot:232730-Rhodomonas_salina.2
MHGKDKQQRTQKRTEAIGGGSEEVGSLASIDSVTKHRAKGLRNVNALEHIDRNRLVHAPKDALRKLEHGVRTRAPSSRSLGLSSVDEQRRALLSSFERGCLQLLRAVSEVFAHAAEARKVARVVELDLEQRVQFSLEVCVGDVLLQVVDGARHKVLPHQRPHRPQHHKLLHLVQALEELRRAEVQQQCVSGCNATSIELPT